MDVTIAFGHDSKQDAGSVQSVADALTSSSPLTSEQCAASGQDQLHALLRAARQLFASLDLSEELLAGPQGTKRSSTPSIVSPFAAATAFASRDAAGSSTHGKGLASPLSVAELRQRYQQASQGLRSSLQQWYSLRGQGFGKPEEIALQASGVGGQHVEEWKAQRAVLQSQLEAHNETLKQLIDNFRHLLDAMQMWSAYSSKLEIQNKSSQR